ncbi:MAG: putative lipoprotein signal peptide [Proteobacteria bacterium]|nr:putative lipoprotein signal peptide [Pseudomonadota bacterium]
MKNKILHCVNLGAKTIAFGALALGLTATSFAQGVDGGQPENGPAPSKMQGCPGPQDMGPQGPGPHRMGPHKPGMPFLHGIDLTPAQSAQLKQMHEKQHEQAAAKHKALHEQHQALAKLVMSDSYSHAKADKIIARIGAIQADMERQRAESGHQLYQILTPEQRVKLQQNMAKGEEMMHHRPPMER